MESLSRTTFNERKRMRTRSQHAMRAEVRKGSTESTKGTAETFGVGVPKAVSLTGKSHDEAGLGQPFRTRINGIGKRRSKVRIARRDALRKHVHQGKNKGGRKVGRGRENLYAAKPKPTQHPSRRG